MTRDVTTDPRIPIPGRPRGHRQAWRWIWFAGVMASAAVGVRADDQRFVDGLRARRLYELAEVFCRDRLAESDLSEAERAAWTAEWIRVNGEYGLQLSGEQREARWRKAHETAADYVRRYGTTSRALLVRVQDALVFLGQGELLRQEAEMARADRETRFQKALDVLQLAVGGLEEIDRDLARAIPTAPLQESPAQLSSDQLLGLRNQVRLHLARVFRNRALCYPDGPDRIAAMTQALEALRGALEQLPADDPLALRATVEQIICYRVMGNLADARRLLEATLQASPPLDLQILLRPEEVRLLLAEHDWETALVRATRDLPGGTSSPDLDLARLEVFIALWQQGDKIPPPKDSTWRAQAVALTRYIEQQHGAYWGRRAEELLLRSAGAGQAADGVEILRRRADDLYLQGKVTDALAAYDEAAQAAARAGAIEEEWLCRARAARLTDKLGDRLETVRRWRELAVSMRTHEQAPAAHWEAIQAAIARAREEPSYVETYRKLLEEHLALWPRGPQADWVRVWLGTLRRHERDWSGALQVLREVAADSEARPEALRCAEGAWHGLLAEHAAHGPPAANDIEQAIRFFRSADDMQSAAQIAAQMAVARLVIEFAAERADLAEQALDTVLAMPALDDDTRQEALSLRVIALALQPRKQTQALEAMQGGANASTSTTWSMVRRLDRHLETLPAAQRQTLARLQLQLLGRLPLDTLSDEDRVDATRWLARAQWNAGARDEAVRTLEGLAAQQPRNGTVQIELARMLEQGGATDHLRRALDQWRIVAKHAPPQSDAWYESKLGTARVQAALGQKQEALRLLRYVQLTAPPAADSPWSSALGELLQSLAP